MAYFYIAATVLLTTYGQLVIKREINRVGEVPTGGDLIPFLVTDVLFRPMVISGFVAALLASLAWMAALTKLDLSNAYPFMSLNFVLVGLLAVPLFGDTFGTPKIIGLTLISIGLVVIGADS
ncbi:MAG: EamA family transporter [Acidimicrobiales bacterium]